MTTFQLKKAILFEDDDFLAINKPSGLVVNNSVTAKDPTLQSILGEKIKITDDIKDTEFGSRGGIVHRLDKGTSGIILVSKNPEAFDNLKNQFKNREVEKHYYAVTMGSFKEVVVEINAPIKRSPVNRMRFAVVEGGRDALTFARKIKILDGFTLFDISPKTGRTHQIRVHFSALGFPIAGDRLYCSKRQYKLSIEKFGRMMLHSYKISFHHPKDGSHMILECLPLEEVWKPFIHMG